MNLIRDVLTLSLLAFIGGCITEPRPVGTSGGSEGSFSITIQEFGNGPTNGKATFQLERIDNASRLTVSFRDSLGTAITLSGPGAPAVGVDREIGEAEGLIGGILTRNTAQGTATYVLTAGTLSVEGLSANRLVGKIEFDAVQREGPAVGSTISGKGNFSASGGNSQT